MKRLTLFILVLLLLTACGDTQANESSVPTPLPLAEPAVPLTIDTDATVAAAIAATSTAAAVVDAAVAAAVAATSAAMPPPPSPTPFDTTEYVTLTEEELAALIDESVNAAIVATDSSADAAAMAAADDTVTPEEVEAIELYLDGAEGALAEAEALLALYTELYWELATVAVDELAAIEAELAALNENIMAMNAVLIDIANTLDAGLELAEAALDELEAAAAAAQTAAGELQVQAGGWAERVETAVAARTANLAALQAQEVAGNLPDTVAQVRSYVEGITAAFGDERISAAELQAVTQQGVNAIASLQANGGPQLESLATTIATLNSQLASGAFNQVRSGIGSLEGMIPELPGGFRP